jgi:hypothetical protein
LVGGGRYFPDSRRQLVVSVPQRVVRVIYGVPVFTFGLRSHSSRDVFCVLDKSGSVARFSFLIVPRSAEEEGFCMSSRSCDRAPRVSARVFVFLMVLLLAIAASRSAQEKKIRKPLVGQHHRGPYRAMAQFVRR